MKHLRGGPQYFRPYSLHAVILYGQFRGTSQPAVHIFGVRKQTGVRRVRRETTYDTVGTCKHRAEK